MNTMNAVVAYNLFEIDSLECCVLKVPLFHFKAFWIIVTCATRIELLYFGRFLAGLTGGGAFVSIPLFVAEVADDQYVKQRFNENIQLS